MSRHCKLCKSLQCSPPTNDNGENAFHDRDTFTPKPKVPALVSTQSPTQMVFAEDGVGVKARRDGLGSVPWRVLM